jgi:hypothetical protein
MKCISGQRIINADKESEFIIIMMTSTCKEDITLNLYALNYTALYKEKPDKTSTKNRKIYNYSWKIQSSFNN